MAIRFKVAQTLRLKVEGKQQDEQGDDQLFDFVLIGHRLQDAHEVQALHDVQKLIAAAGSRTPVTDALLYIYAADGKPVERDGKPVERFTNWSGVDDENGQPLPFTTERLRALLNRPGLATLVFWSYVRESGAKEKN